MPPTVGEFQPAPGLFGVRSNLRPAGAVNNRLGAEGFVLPRAPCVRGMPVSGPLAIGGKPPHPLGPESVGIPVLGAPCDRPQGNCVPNGFGAMLTYIPRTGIP